jgi:magnesium chelatase family protein
MLVKVLKRRIWVEATTITVEVNMIKELISFSIPDNAIKESSYRIAAALKNNGYSMPGKR